MNYNLTWEHTDERSLLAALAGHEFGNTLAEAWPKLRAKKAHDAEVHARLLELAPNDVVAEIGSGIGIEADILAPRVTQYHCFDISESFLEICKKSTSHHANISYHLMQPGDLTGLHGQRITKILSGGVFIHFNLFDIYIYLKQIEQILQSGGRFTFNMINAEFDGLLEDPTWQAQVEMYRRDKTNIFGLMSWLSPSTVQKMLKKLGFIIDSVFWPEEQYVHFTVIKP